MLLHTIYNITPISRNIWLPCQIRTDIQYFHDFRNLAKKLISSGSDKMKNKKIPHCRNNGRIIKKCTIDITNKPIQDHLNSWMVKEFAHLCFLVSNPHICLLWHLLKKKDLVQKERQRKYRLIAVDYLKCNIMIALSCYYLKHNLVIY